MRRFSRPCVFVFCLLALPLSSWADPVTLVSSQRAIVVSVAAGATNAGTTTLFDRDALSNTIGAIDPATGASAIASASLFSSLSPATGVFDGRGGTGTTQNSSSVSAGAHAQSSYFVTFDVLSERRFDFDAQFTVSGGNETNRSFWSAELFQSPHGPTPVYAFNFLDSSTDSLLTSGFLAPGRYGFLLTSVSDSISAATIGAASVDYRFSLLLSDADAPVPTPEPASMLLLATGLAGLAARRIRLRGSLHS